MATKKYGKLVRDKIPELINDQGKRAITHVANPDEYWQKLLVKLQEEVAEFVRGGDPEEIADILEVLEAICAHKRIKQTDLSAIKAIKATKRGKFQKRIILDEVQDSPVSATKAP